MSVNAHNWPPCPINATVLAVGRGQWQSQDGPQLQRETDICRYTLVSSACPFSTYGPNGLGSTLSRWLRNLTESLLNEVVECMPVTRIGELVVIGWKLLQTLHRNSAEVSRKCCVLSEHHGAPGNKAVYQRLRPHLWPFEIFSNEPDMFKFLKLPWKQCRPHKNISNMKIKSINYRATSHINCDVRTTFA